jgi:hypothetical protein
MEKSDILRDDELMRRFTDFRRAYLALEQLMKARGLELKNL